MMVQNMQQMYVTHIIGPNFKNSLSRIELFPVGFQHQGPSFYTPIPLPLNLSALSQVRIHRPPSHPPQKWTDAHSAQSNKKSCFKFFRFLIFELWLIVFTNYGDTPGVPSTTKNKVFVCIS